MLEYSLGAVLIAFLFFLFMETRRRVARTRHVVAEEKSKIADDSGMTATLGVFTPDTQTTVIIGASEELGAFYYRMLRQYRVIIRSRINLANLARVEFLVNSQPVALDISSDQLTTALRATDMADKALARYTNEAIKSIQRAGLRIHFYDETGSEKALEITTLRAGDDRHRFERVQLLKTTIWWVSYLKMSSRQARHTRARLEHERQAG